MKKLNLKELKVFTDYKRQNYETGDSREIIGNYLYNNVPWSEINESLIEKIRESDGIIEISSTEENAIKNTFKYGIYTSVKNGILVALNQDKVDAKTGDLTGKTEGEKREVIAKAMRETLDELK